MAATTPPRSNADQVQLRLSVDAEKTRADLIIPAAFERSMLGPSVCLGFLQQGGIELTDAVRKAVADLVAKAAAAKNEDVRGLVARAVPAVDGEDGWIEWQVDQPAAATEEDAPANPDAEAEAQAEADARAVVDDADPVSYYDRCAFTMVEPGQILGLIHRATPGEDGRDVKGGTLQAKSGRDPELQIDESLMIDAAGRIIAQNKGVLYRKPGSACIRRQIVIDEYVDFSTGNIDFDGDIVIRRGVRDCFVVKAEGNVEVHGLIEAAHVITGLDLLAIGGFAGRERGQAHIGRDLKGKYLDNVEGEVRQDLLVDREVINCDFKIHGKIDSPHGTLIGGHFVVTRQIHVAQLGSGAGVPTVLIVGSVPRLEPLRQKLAGLMLIFEQRHEKLLEEQAMLTKLTQGNRASASQKERLTELMFELTQAQQALEKGRPALAKLEASIERQRTVDVKIERKLCSGVRFVYEGCTYRVIRELRGPLTVQVGEGGRLVYRVGEAEPRPLHDITEVEGVARAA